VLGQVEEPDGQPLAATGTSSRTFVYGALLMLILGVWLALAGAWMRPSTPRD
jgi:hypothetical protein